MALSGTLETFSLPDVLRLLSSTKKTGLLALDGDRGRGRIWVRDGAIVAAEADRAANEQVSGVAFELLRHAEASFEFDSGAQAPSPGDPHDVEDVLAEAESRLSEWREIEAVVPSLDVWVQMVAEIDAERTVTPAQWKVLAQVGTGATGHALAEHLGQGEYDVCRQLRDLVDDGMVELGDAAAAAAATPVTPTVEVDAWPAPLDEPTFVEPALDTEAVTSLGADLASFVAAGTVESPVDVDFSEPAPLDQHAQDDQYEEPTAFASMVDTGAVAEHDEEPSAHADAHDGDIDIDGDGDFLAQLSHLSPKAAAAVEATWVDDAVAGDLEAGAEPEADTSEAPEVAAQAGEHAAPAADDIDQNLLLRFLSSAKG